MLYILHSLINLKKIDIYYLKIIARQEKSNLSKEKFIDKFLKFIDI